MPEGVAKISTRQTGHIRFLVRTWAGGRCTWRSLMRHVAVEGAHTALLHSVRACVQCSSCLNPFVLTTNAQYMVW